MPTRYFSRVPQRRPLWANQKFAYLLFANLLLVAVPSMAHAQALTLKRTLSANVIPGCESVPTASSAATVIRRDVGEARRALSAGQELALQGDQAGARAAFARAATLDPADERIAYEYARTLEDARDNSGAVREYCRYLRLTTGGRDVTEARTRLNRLLPKGNTDVSARAQERFRAGVAAFDARHYQIALTAFDDVVRYLPAAPEGVFNRALVHSMLGHRAESLRDFEAYLVAAPGADDRVQVARAFGALRRPIYSTSTALTRAVVPGLGQFYTGRAAAGVVVMSTVGAAVAAAFYTRSGTREVMYTDPNGVPAPFTETFTERPYMTPAIAVGAGVTLLAALEAAWFAQRSQRAPVQIVAAPGAVGVQIRF